MYDNKPWHNCLGHYDEIHCESSGCRSGRARETPSRHRVHRGESLPEGVPGEGRGDQERKNRQDSRPSGDGGHFAPVMTEVYGLDDPESPNLKDDPYWLFRFVFIMGTHFTAMPPFHFQAELHGPLTDTFPTQRRPVAIYCEGIKWLNWALEMLEGTRTEFLGLGVPSLPYSRG